MAATTEFDNQHGTSPGTTQANAADAYLMSADIASSTANRDANPVVAPAAGTVYSYERWTLLEATGGTFTTMDTFRHYASGYANPTGVTFNTSAQNPSINTATYITPKNTVSTGLADQGMPTVDPANEQIQGSLSIVGDKTEYAVTQVAVTNSATAGFEQTVTWAWNEVA